MTDSGLREGGLAESLYRRMGSTPAAAALLRSLVCPITKVRTTWMHRYPSRLLDEGGCVTA